MKKGVRYLKVVVYLSLILLGFVVGLAVSHYTKLPLSEEINLIDLATLVVTIFLAVYVPAVLDRQLQTTRDRKELLEKRVSDYQTISRRVNMLVQGERMLSPDDYATIKNLLDIAEQRLNTLASLIKSSKLDDALNREIAGIIKTNNEHKTLLYTKSDVESGFMYSKETREEEEILYNKLDGATSLLIFRISDAN